MVPIDVGRRLDEGDWGGYQKWLVLLTALTIVFDGIDNQLLGVAMRMIMREWWFHARGVLSGRVDRQSVPRRPRATPCGSSPRWRRPERRCLAAEYVPLRQRPMAVTLTIVCVPLGATIAGLLGIRALPLVGWRTLFVIGGMIPVLGALVLTRLLLESPRLPGA